MLQVWSGNFNQVKAQDPEYGDADEMIEMAREKQERALREAQRQSDLAREKQEREAREAAARSKPQPQPAKDMRTQLLSIDDEMIASYAGAKPAGSPEQQAATTHLPTPPINDPNDTAKLPDLERQIAEGRWDQVKVNTEEHQGLASAFQVSSIPAVKLFRDGVVVDEFVGFRPEAEIRRWLEPHLPSAARARLEIATKNVRDLPELTFGMRRERPLQDAAWESSAIVGVRIPLATDSRNRPKIAAANADLIEAEALLPYEKGRVDAERDAALRELERSDQSLARAETRRALATEMRREYARAFTHGNIDLPQRLRVEADAFDAELAAARARIEAARSISRYNQALGILP